MSTSIVGAVRKAFGWLFGFLDASRRVLLNLIFLGVIVAVVWSLTHRGPPALMDKTALVLGLAHCESAVAGVAVGKKETSRPNREKWSRKNR